MLQMQKEQHLVHSRSNLGNWQTQVLQTPSHLKFDSGVKELSLRLLEEQTYGIGQRWRGMLVGVPASNDDEALHRPAGQVGSQPSQQKTECGLARVAGAHYCQPLTGLDTKIETVENPLSGRVW
jgi:hypothetical protein